MMLAGRSGTDELEAERARFDVETRGEPAVGRVPATVGGEHQPELLGWSNRTTAPPMRPHDIKIDQSHRILVASGSRERQGIRGGLILAAVAASAGLASIGLLSAYLFSTPDTASSTAPIQSSDPAAGMAIANKGDRLPIHHAITREINRAAPVKSPHGPKPVASTAVARPKPSPTVAPPTSSPDTRPTAAQVPATSTSDSAAKPNTETPLAPVPETRPTTISGWTLREVVDGTAVLEGPGGLRRVKRGDTIPEVGRIIGILRWGNRLIVATSRGLISTP
jgi:hypothetical protein